MVCRAAYDSLRSSKSANTAWNQDNKKNNNGNNNVYNNTHNQQKKSSKTKKKRRAQRTKLNFRFFCMAPSPASSDVFLEHNVRTPRDFYAHNLYIAHAHTCL